MYKVSANIVCKDEKYWIKESILSIVDYFDDIIFVDDNSTDGSLEIVKELSIKYPHIKVYESSYHKKTRLGDLKNYAMSKSKNELVFRWDADFIAYPDIWKLLKYAINNYDKYDAYPLIGPNLMGDINHYQKGKETFGPETYFYKKNKMSFIKTNKYNACPSFNKKTIFCKNLLSDL